MTEETVLVAGGGIAGLAMARALRRHELPVEVAERGDAGRTGGLAINLPGNAVTAFAALGLGDGLAKLGRPTRRREYRSAAGKVLFAVDEDEFWGARARPRCVRRSDLLALLADGLDAPVRQPLAVSAVDGLDVTFDGGERQAYGFVVGADGVRSAVRAAMFGATTVRASVLSAASWRFMAPNPGVDCWTVWSGAGGAFLLIPVDDTEVYGYASATRGGPVDPDPSWLHTTFGGYPEPVRAVLDSVAKNPESLFHSPIEEIRLPGWSSGRRVLIGDAAHATAPVWAQGAALAAEDALVLAALLAEGDWDTVGARYEQRRRERVAHVQAATDRFSRAAGLPIWLRDRLLPLIGPRTYRETYGVLRVVGSEGG
ncbi:FAD-dependent monooxygenase [Actinoplanes aureus]|uniref:FAD-dependent monooxygenase n=1 Tax=Actinoplanes aureus TaxID=2792083 RepID=A0A931CCX0_9ACTN|nr:FAD-dependent monooxygenase [Actinoplanes aureus]MBG0564266.1 FAD-dependent monooxygenase [Actinoplanes aureus]